MRVSLVIASVAAALVFSDATLTAQGNDCAPPTYTGPDGPRPSGPGSGSTSGGDSTSTGSGDTARPVPTSDGTTTGRDRGGARTPRGIAIPLTRGKSSKSRLRILWDYPKADGERHLDYESALSKIRGMDPRPLLVLREGSQYGQGYDKMLTVKMSDEKTTLLTRWFHCVRLSTTVMNDAHPLRSLFSGKYPPHCYITTWDGHHSIPLSGVHPKSYIQRSMMDILRKEYRKDPKKGVRQWLRVLDGLDTVDSSELTVRKQIDEIEFKHGPKSKKLRALKIRLNKLSKQRAKLRMKEKQVCDLGLIRKLAGANGSKLLDRLRGQ